MKNNENYIYNKSMFIGEFNKKINGIIYFINGSYFECEWKDNNSIDEAKIGKFCLNDSNKICKIIKTNKWIKIIRRELLIHYGNYQVNKPIASNIK